MLARVPWFKFRKKLWAYSVGVSDRNLAKSWCLSLTKLSGADSLFSNFLCALCGEVRV
jgi:hypothetical protein